MNLWVVILFIGLAIMGIGIFKENKKTHIVGWVFFSVGLLIHIITRQ